VARDGIEPPTFRFLVGESYVRYFGIAELVSLKKPIFSSYFCVIFEKSVRLDPLREMFEKPFYYIITTKMFANFSLKSETLWKLLNA